MHLRKITPVILLLSLAIPIATGAMNLFSDPLVNTLANASLAEKTLPKDQKTPKKKIKKKATPKASSTSKTYSTDLSGKYVLAAVIISPTLAALLKKQVRDPEVILILAFFPIIFPGSTLFHFLTKKKNPGKAILKTFNYWAIADRFIRFSLWTLSKSLEKFGDHNYVYYGHVLASTITYVLLCYFVGLIIDYYVAYRINKALQKYYSTSPSKKPIKK